MPKIIEKTLIDLIPSLPGLTEFRATTPPKDELFLCALGFEDRCLAVPSYLNKNGYKANFCVYFQYQTNIDDNNKNKDSLLSCLESFTSKDKIKYLDADDPMLNGKLKSLLTANLRRFDSPPSITIDISVFSTPLILTIIAVAFQHDVKIKILYSEAADYYPSKKDYNENKSEFILKEKSTLEDGVSHIAPSPEHPGVHVENVPDYTIHFPSFNKIRGNSLLHKVDTCFVDNCESSNCLWVLGKPPSPHNAWRLSAIKEINEVSKYHNTTILSTLDYKEILLTLEEVYQSQWQSRNITITTLGSKMQNIAIALFCMIHPEVRVLVSRPKKFKAKSYSRGHADIWALNFGRTATIVQLLKSVGTLQLIPNMRA